MRRTALRRRMKLTGKRDRWERWRSQERLAVHKRGRCEVEGCRNRDVEVHHNFGRLPEPWASSRLSCSLICRSHHEDVTGRTGKGVDADLRELLRAAAVERLRADVQRALVDKGSRAVLFFDQDGTEWPANRRWHYVIEVAELNGVQPPEFES